MVYQYAYTKAEDMMHNASVHSLRGVRPICKMTTANPSLRSKGRCVTHITPTQTLPALSCCGKTFVIQNSWIHPYSLPELSVLAHCTPHPPLGGVEPDRWRRWGDHRPPKGSKGSRYRRYHQIQHAPISSKKWTFNGRGGREKGPTKRNRTNAVTKDSKWSDSVPANRSRREHMESDRRSARHHVE